MIEVEIADGLEAGLKRQVIGVARILLIRLETYDCKKGTLHMGDKINFKKYN